MGGFLTILLVYSLLLVLALGIGKMVLVVGGVEPGDGSYFVVHQGNEKKVLVDRFHNTNKFAPLKSIIRMNQPLTELKSGELGVSGSGSLGSLIHGRGAVGRETSSSALLHLNLVHGLLTSVLLPAPETN